MDPTTAPFDLARFSRPQRVGYSLSARNLRRSCGFALIFRAFPGEIAVYFKAVSPQTHLTTNAVHRLTGGHVTFDIGDKVIYPNHGLGVVQRIESRTIMGMTCGFYQLRMVSNDTTVLVPVENADNVGLRKAVGNQEVDRLFNPAERRQDRHPPELEGPLQGQFGSDAHGLALRRGRSAEEPHVSRALEEPVVPREAHARPREVPRHLRDCRGDARGPAARREPRRARARTLVLVEARRWRVRPRSRRRRSPPSTRRPCAGRGAARRNARTDSPPTCTHAEGPGRTFPAGPFA